MKSTRTHNSKKKPTNETKQTKNEILLFVTLDEDVKRTYIYISRAFSLGVLRPRIKHGAYSHVSLSANYRFALSTQQTRLRSSHWQLQTLLESDINLAEWKKEERKKNSNPIHLWRNILVNNLRRPNESMIQSVRTSGILYRKGGFKWFINWNENKISRCRT